MASIHDTDGWYPHWYSCRDHGSYPGFNSQSPGCPGCNQRRMDNLRKLVEQGMCWQCGKKPCACPYVPDVGR